MWARCGNKETGQYIWSGAEVCYSFIWILILSWALKRYYPTRFRSTARAGWGHIV